MRRSMIAAFLLGVLPSTALGCFDEHKAGWFNEMPVNSWERPEASREGNAWEEISGVWVIAAGMTSLALIAVSFRAFSRAGEKDRKDPAEAGASRPLALPADWPGDRTRRVDPAHQPGVPTRIVPDKVETLYAVAAGAE